MNHQPSTAPRFVPVADHALLVEFADEIDEEAGASVHALDRSIAAARIDGVVEVVPAYVSLLVDFDPLVTDHDRIETALRALVVDVLSEGDAAGARPLREGEHVASACFDHDLAPDLVSVAEATGLSVDEVIEVFLGETYRVAMYGFAPGYAYLAGVDHRIRLPRKEVPVRGVAAGSIIIAGPQALITTIDMPTGWWVIGRSGTKVHRPDSATPFLFDPGDRVRFRRVDRSALSVP